MTDRPLGTAFVALAGSCLEASERLDRAATTFGRDEFLRPHVQLFHDLRDLLAVISRHCAAVGGELRDDTPVRPPTPAEVQESRPNWDAVRGRD